MTEQSVIVGLRGTWYHHCDVLAQTYLANREVDGRSNALSWRGDTVFWYSAGPCPLVLTLTEILQCLKKHGQRLDSELATETGVPLATVRQQIAELSATGAIITCNQTRFEHGKRIEGLLCRVSGWIPSPAPGRKAKLPA